VAPSVSTAQQHAILSQVRFQIILFNLLECCIEFI
jgi:hypothetical protein